MKLFTIFHLYFTGTSEGAEKGWDTRGRGRKTADGWFAGRTNYGWTYPVNEKGVADNVFRGKKVAQDMSGDDWEKVRIKYVRNAQRGIMDNHTRGALERWNELRQQSQNALKKQYGNTITLYRGVSNDPKNIVVNRGGLQKGEPISFSKNKDVARAYALLESSGRGAGGAGSLPHVLTARVPVESVVFSHDAIPQDKLRNDSFTRHQSEVLVSPDYADKIKWSAEKLNDNPLIGMSQSAALEGFRRIGKFPRS